MKKSIIYGLMFIFLINVVLAITFISGEDSTLYGQCILPNGSLGGDNMTLSIYYPNSTSFVNNSLMINYDTGLYKYSFTAPYEEGYYTYIMICSNNESTATSTAQFEIKATAAEDVNVNLDNYSIFPIVLGQIALIIIFFSIGMFQPQNGLRFFGFAIALIQAIIMMGLIYANELGNTLSILLRVNFYACITLLLVYGMYGMWVLSVKIGTVGVGDDENEQGKWNKNWKLSKK